MQYVDFIYISFNFKQWDWNDNKNNMANPQQLKQHGVLQTI